MTQLENKSVIINDSKMSCNKFMRCDLNVALMSDVRTKKYECITLAYLQLSGFAQGVDRP